MLTPSSINNSTVLNFQTFVYYKRSLLKWMFGIKQQRHQFGLKMTDF